MPGARTVDADRDAFNALSHESQRLGRRAAEVAECAQVANRVNQTACGQRVERAGAGGVALDEQAGSRDDLIESHRPVRRIRDGGEKDVDPGCQFVTLSRALV